MGYSICIEKSGLFPYKTANFNIIDICQHRKGHHKGFKWETMVLSWNILIVYYSFSIFDTKTNSLQKTKIKNSVVFDAGGTEILKNTLERNDLQYWFNEGLLEIL